MTKKRYDITAIIYDKKGNILSIGRNSYHKTHTYQAKMANKVGMPDKIFLHAEIDAIVKCSNMDSAHRIVVIRSDGGNAKPCKVCQHAISLTNIRVIKHT